MSDSPILPPAEGGDRVWEHPDGRLADARDEQPKMLPDVPVGDLADFYEVEG